MDTTLDRGDGSGFKNPNARRGTQAPNFKNFKNLKKVVNINDVYRISNKEKDKLGEGSFGAVKRVERISTGTKHALKTI